MEIISTVEHLSFRYLSYSGKASEELFSDASFELYPEKIHILYGKPESGKTTLARILAGLVPLYHGGKLAGKISIAGTDIIKTASHDLLQTIGMVFQNPEEQLFMPVCEDEIIFPLEHLDLSREEIGERLERVISFYELEKYRSSNPASLSGGEKKRLLMAVLDAIDPVLWVLDETFEELDVYWREKILSSLSERKKTVLVLASKDIELYHTYGNRFGVIRAQESGNTIEFSSLEESLSDMDDGLGDLTLTAVDYETAEKICEVKDLEFSYAHADRDFTLEITSLDLHDGEVLALYGPNGSGKSTICRLLCGLMKPDTGTISIGGSGEELMRHTGYLFQNPDFQIFLPTIHDELNYGLKQMGMGKHEAESRISDAAGLFRLGDVNDPPAIMSYGKRKRLQAAVYYLLDRKVCILDETDSGVSLADYTHMVSLLKDRVDAMILITHDTRIATHCAHRIIGMDSGRITEEKIVCR